MTTEEPQIASMLASRAGSQRRGPYCIWQATCPLTRSTKPVKSRRRRVPGKHQDTWPSAIASV